MNFWNISDLDTFNRNVVLKNQKMHLESFYGTRRILKKNMKIFVEVTRAGFFSVYEVTQVTLICDLNYIGIYLL